MGGKEVDFKIGHLTFFIKHGKQSHLIYEWAINICHQIKKSGRGGVYNFLHEIFNLPIYKKCSPSCWLKIHKTGQWADNKRYSLK